MNQPEPHELVFLLQGTQEHDVLKEFQAALQQADTAHRELTGMGTTVTIAYTLRSRLFVTHVGDSRCYLLHGSKLQCLTHDHTLVAGMVSRGMLQPEEAAWHCLRQVMTNVVGGNELIVDVECHRVDLKAVDMLLVCSDGFTRMLPTTALRPFLRPFTIRGRPANASSRRPTRRVARTTSPVIAARFEADS